MSKVLLVGDAHGDLPFLRAALLHAAEEGCSRVFQVGDFGLWPPKQAADRWLKHLDAFIANAGLEALHWLDGNHDWHDELGRLRDTGARDDEGFVICEPATRVRYAPRGHRWSWDGVNFAALGGAFSVDWRGRTRSESWWPDDEQPSAADYERLVAGGEVDVLLTHDSPLGVTFKSGIFLPPEDQEKADETRRMLRMAVNRLAPKLLVHGHWHQRQTTTLRTQHLFGAEPRSFETVVESLGANITRRSGAWTVIDLDALAQPTSR